MTFVALFRIEELAFVLIFGVFFASILIGFQKANRNAFGIGDGLSLCITSSLFACTILVMFITVASRP